MVTALAEAMKIQGEQVLSASTGVIGFPLPLDKILPALPELVSRGSDNAEPFATAILTTDLVPKTVHTTVRLTGGTVTITGICKGSGMIHPNMATMLGYLLTDAALTPKQADVILRESTDVSFNMISVDGDTSTNDVVFLMANGASGAKVESADDIAKFTAALTQVAQLLAQSIARDGEGATKLLEVELRGLPNVELARKAARGITVSPLIKSAIHGADPNWGRIVSAAGYAGILFQEEELSLWINGTSVYQAGTPTNFDAAKLSGDLRANRDVHLRLVFGRGEGSIRFWTCDLTEGYIKINGSYRT
jgi:glutamate N-acetyltransferase/amino-acid N-acetyltransferase